MFNDFRAPLPGNESAKVRAALFGAGVFGTGIVAQSKRVPALEISAVADTDLSAVFRAFSHGGVSRNDVAVCINRAEVRRAVDAGRRIATTNARLLVDLPIDVVIEATGVPEAGAAHAKLAIEHGKHVAMVTKEADACVGPMLKHLADQAGVIYTAVDGDQHGLLIALVRWARSIGLEVLCGGKALDSELVVHSDPDRLTHWSSPLTLTNEEFEHFRPKNRDIREMVTARSAALGVIGGAKPWDIVELTIAANATGLRPDVPGLHCPALRATEIAAALCPVEFGGVLPRRGCVDAVQLVRGVNEMSFHGGVFVVVAVSDELTRQLLIAHDAIGHPESRTTLIVWPHHLLGIEAIGSILAAVRGRVATGAHDYRPRYDVVYRAARPLPAGTVIGDDHSPDITAEMIPVCRLGPDAPLPAGLARGNRLTVPVPVGRLITGEMIELPVDSVLWSLRSQQDELFDL